MPKLTNHLTALREGLEHQIFSPAPPERAAILGAVVSNAEYYAPRGLSSPRLATDLGVRRVEDVRIFYVEHCKIAGVSPLDSNSLFELVRDIDLPVNADAIDSLILFFGDYQGLADWIVRNQAAMLASEDSNTLVHAGVILGAVSKSEAISFFDRASQVAPTMSSAYAAQHRAAVTELKRFGNAQAARQRLEEAYHEFIEPDETEERLTSQAIWYNLHALVSMTMKDDQAVSISEQLQRAQHSATEYLANSHSTPAGKSRAGRYLSQININILRRCFQPNTIGLKR